MEIAGTNGQSWVQIISFISAIVVVAIFIYKIRGDLDALKTRYDETKAKADAADKMATNLAIIEQQLRTHDAQINSANAAAVSAREAATHLTNNVRVHLDEQISHCIKKGDDAIATRDRRIEGLTDRTNELEKQFLLHKQKLDSITNTVEKIEKTSNETNRAVHELIGMLQQYRPTQAPQGWPPMPPRSGG